ncbi:permease [Anderseniella sp. Alg231-50]|uniref:permease n=1 Tax=Anderseniella sp. Alg231-50 TaxID=1922226 RepID=UPI000D54DA3D
MSDHSQTAKRPTSLKFLLGLAAVCGLAFALLWPQTLLEMAGFVVWGLVVVAPIVIPGILLAAWIMASGAGSHIAGVFEGRILYSIVAASAIGAITPVCGVTVLPLMAGLLAAGVPLAPVMAFWLSSPVTDPAMLATTAATLGVGFAVGKTVAAFGLGLWGGAITSVFARRDWAMVSLRSNRIVGKLSQRNCGAALPFDARIWKDRQRKDIFRENFAATTRLILICLIPAFAAEYALNAVLQPDALSAYVGSDVWWAIPFAVFVGAPAYLDGYAALPLTRGLMDHGMSPGAAMAFLVSGGVVSIWGAMAIFPVLRLKPFVLYLVLALSGSLAAGYAFDWVV